MPPVGFFASATSSWDSASGSLTLLTPSAVRENDVVLAALFIPNTTAVTPPDGWDLVTNSGSSGPLPYTIFLYRRIAVADEPAQHVFACNAGTTPEPLGALLLYRDLSAGAPEIADARQDVNPASTNYPAPSVVLVNYSDLTLLCYYSTANPPATFTVAAGTTERAYKAASAAGGALLIADYLQEAVGATPVEAATASVASSGFAVTIALAANPTVQAPSVVPDVPGAIGLPTVGV